MIKATFDNIVLVSVAGNPVTESNYYEVVDIGPDVSLEYDLHVGDRAVIERNHGTYFEIGGIKYASVGENNIVAYWGTGDFGGDFEGKSG